MVINITNKKYQPIKIFLTDSETVIIPGKESKKVNILKESEHILDLTKSGLITIKKVEA